MIHQFRTLHRVKKLREDKALRAMQEARREAARAQERLDAARAEVAESEASLPAREAAIYAKIMRQIVGIPAIDGAKERVQALIAEHQRLIDRAARARDRLKRAEEAVEEARAEYGRKRAETEKIETMTEELETRAADEAAAAEEAEIEDLFSTPRKGPAG
ncbi:MAG: type III secretion system stalk subunit SctO [Paracoccaceae bacterium]